MQDFKDKRDFYQEEALVEDIMNLRLYLEMMKTICPGDQAQRQDLNRLSEYK